MFLALCVSLVLVESYLPNAPAQTRPELPGCVMLAALPHRRLPGESPARATGVAEAVCSNTVHVQTAGFTLIELSIVLVIIGLIVGGVLVGRDLISAAEVRAQVTQIEKYNSAVNTFRGKYNAIPGDMTAAIAQQFGFTVETSCTGSRVGNRNGDGLIDGWAIPLNLAQAEGETALFWQDISNPVAGSLIEGAFPNSGAVDATCQGGAGNIPAFSLTPGINYVGDYLPVAKIGNGNFLYVYEQSGSNWFGLSAVTSQSLGLMLSSPVLTVTQASKIDTKMDDGLPTSGNVQAVYINNSFTTTTYAPNTATSGGTASSCYDTTTGTYSVTINNGSGGNCALSFKMQ